MTDHLVGWVRSAVFAEFSHAAESVIGGRLQFMLPDRSTTKSKFVGRGVLCYAACAQLSTTGTGVMNVGAPAAPPVANEPPVGVGNGALPPTPAPPLPEMAPTSAGPLAPPPVPHAGDAPTS